ncbi:MAG UNVERIFIED_CONTAM: hypothetical protein LVQ98_03660 [Rickettsiaceae bacterium]
MEASLQSNDDDGAQSTATANTHLSAASIASRATEDFDDVEALGAGDAT